MAGPISTIPEFLAATVASRGEEPALGIIRGGELAWRTWREVGDDAGRLAAAICAAGVEPGDRVAHVSENRYEWIITDLAIHLAGAVHVPIHVTLSGEQIAEQIADCGARLVFVSREELLAKFVGRLDAAVQVFVHDEQGEDNKRALLGKPAVAPARIHDEQPLAESQRLAGATAKPQAAGRATSDSSLLAGCTAKPQAGDLATILYTSGTTGRPRGVMLSQRNLASNAAAVADLHGAGSDQTRLNVLPLSHIYARTCDLYTWVYRGSRLVLAEGRETLLGSCQLAQPTALSAVPYLYQRIADGVRSCGAANESAALRAAFGGRMERLSCGGAALAPEYEAWYAQCGLPVTCGYGLTEASPVVTMSTLEAHRAGCVGQPPPGIEVKLADDGEVLARSPGVMLGYWQNDAATAEVIHDGWLHTGDLGALDADGYLRIIGRKKEMIVLSTGKNVSPTRVENLLTASPLVEQAAVFGEGQPALVALIVPSARSEEQGAGSELFAAEIKRCLAAAAREEQVRDFVLIDRPFAIDEGELTPKLSLCRSVIARNFARELAGMTVSDRSSGRAKTSKSGVAAGAKGLSS